MKLLFLSHDIPSPAASDSVSLYYLIRSLSTIYGHHVTLISFVSERSRIEDLELLKTVCSVENPVPIHWGSLGTLLLKAVGNSLLKLPCNLKNHLLVNELDYYYDRRMDQLIREALKTNQFDLIVSTRQMASYIVDVHTPKVVQPYDALSEWHRQVAASSRGLKRIQASLRSALNESYERHIYVKFDACLVVTEQDKQRLESLNPRTRCIVIPNGVDTDYFAPINVDEQPSCLVFVARLKYAVPIANVLHFYNEVLPLIRHENPDVKLYLVGRDPAEAIRALSADPSVNVTGYVEDVRPYVAKSTVVISPDTLGTGIKNKVLEAMSMGKAVVTTKLGAQGIAVRNREHLVVADTPSDFAKETLSLLTDRSTRATLGANARKLVEEQYSWDSIAKTVNQLLTNIVSEKE
jgi:sugar transferase (PEP-CTERM/EpsH1 system associated)